MFTILSPNVTILHFSGMLPWATFLLYVVVLLTTNLIKIDYVVTAQLNFWFLLNVLVI